MKRIITVVAVVILLVVLWHIHSFLEEQEVGINFYTMKNDDVSKEYRLFTKELEKQLDRALKKYPLARVYDVYIKEEIAEMTEPGGTHKSKVIALYVEGNQPLDRFYTEEISEEKYKWIMIKGKAGEFVQEIVERLRELNNREQMKKSKNKMLVWSTCDYVGAFSFFCNIMIKSLH